MEEALHNMEERSGRLFEMLDLDGSGYLDVVELQVRQSPSYISLTPLPPAERLLGSGHQAQTHSHRRHAHRLHTSGDVSRQEGRCREQFSTHIATHS